MELQHKQYIHQHFFHHHHHQRNMQIGFKLIERGETNINSKKELNWLSF